MASHFRTQRRLVQVVSGAVVLIGAALLIHRLTLPSLPIGPVEIAWDREACAHCRMHIGDPHFAAQLHTKNGEVFSFDDVGCLLRQVASSRDDVHAMYFHAQHGAEWIPASEVRFVTGQNTPMGFGLGAVRDDGQPGLLDLATALERTHERHAEMMP